MKTKMLLLLSSVVSLLICICLLSNTFLGSISFSNSITKQEVITKTMSGTPTKTLTLKSKTVCSIASAKSQCINNLTASVYVTDVNSDKWVILIHGVTSKGSEIYSSFGKIYEYIGYNIITPNLRGHGTSGGEVAFGYLESLDIYDWIKELNSNWTNFGVKVSPKTIIVHGHSMGAATTLQLATNPDIASAKGTSPYTKTLTQLKVKGFIDGAGYTSISRIMAYVNNYQYTSSSPIMNSVLDSVLGDSLMDEYKLGLTASNYDKYSNVFSFGRKFPSGSKIMIVHGTDDTVVPYSNANVVSNNISPGILVKKWSVDGLGHNSITTNTMYNYALLIYNFTKCLENTSCTSI